MPDLNEAKTRALLINPQLERAGWNLSDHSQVQFEVPVQGYDPTPWNGFTDFCLYDVDDSVLAIIEANQHDAIRRVAEAFEGGRRRALLVMAPGTGKTRTTMGLIDVFLQSSYAQKVLFLADRDALVEQALNDGFKAHL